MDLKDNGGGRKSSQDIGLGYNHSQISSPDRQARISVGQSVAVPTLMTPSKLQPHSEKIHSRGAKSELFQPTPPNIFQMGERPTAIKELLLRNPLTLQQIRYPLDGQARIDYANKYEETFRDGMSYYTHTSFTLNSGRNAVDPFYNNDRQKFFGMPIDDRHMKKSDPNHNDFTCNSLPILRNVLTLF